MSLRVDVLTLASCAGAELNDFAVFTTFGLASALLLGVDGPLNGFLAIIYVLTTSFRLCFYSSGEWNPHSLRSEDRGAQSGVAVGSQKLELRARTPFCAVPVCELSDLQTLATLRTVAPG